MGVWEGLEMKTKKKVGKPVGGMLEHRTSKAPQERVCPSASGTTCHSERLSTNSVRQVIALCASQSTKTPGEPVPRISTECFVDSRLSFKNIMFPRKVLRGRPRRNVEEQEVQNAPEVMTNQVGQEREARQEEADTLRIREFLRMNPPSFTGSNTTVDPENFIEGLKRVGLCFNEGRAAMLIGDIDISRLMEYVQQVEEDKLKDREEYCNKKAKTGNECGGIHPVKCRDGQTVSLKCGQEGHFTRKCPNNKQGGENPGKTAQSSSLAPPNRVAPRGATSGTCGGENCLYAITSRQEQENSPDVVLSMIKVFTFDVYALLDPGASLSFVTSYIVNKFNILPEKAL
ncbi:uncharacterized protein [Solanum lycopersicum]|uniref:uncharacterized protein n=1 Tax=Solanum lycopersicum TaxID=4081 RepID=UPI0037495712